MVSLLLKKSVINLHLDRLNLGNVVTIVSAVLLIYALNEWPSAQLIHHDLIVKYLIIIGFLSSTCYYVLSLSGKSAVLLSLFFMYFTNNYAFSCGYVNEISICFFLCGGIPLLNADKRYRVAITALYIGASSLLFYQAWLCSSDPFDCGFALLMPSHYEFWTSPYLWKMYDFWTRFSAAIAMLTGMLILNSHSQSLSKKKP